MHISILMFILIILIAIFVGALIGYGLCYWWFVKALSGFNLFE